MFAALLLLPAFRIAQTTPLTLLRPPFRCAAHAQRALDPSNIMNPAKMFITPADVGGSTAIPALYHRQDTDKERSYSW